MSELLQANWILLVVALLIGVLVAWWVFAANRTTKVEIEPGDEDAKGAKRNQALIDAPPAAGDLSSAANTQKVAAAPAIADAEAGPSVAPPSPPPASPPVPAPPPQTAPAPAPAAADDDLTQIKGLGPKLRAQLNEMGIASFAQIAAWDDAKIDRIDAQLGRFQGRIRRDNWVEQARFLAAGDRAGFEGRFGKS